MFRTTIGGVLFCILIFSAQNVYGGGVNFYVKATAVWDASSTALVGKAMTATLTATAYNPPTTDPYHPSAQPSWDWSWSFDVEYAETPGNWGPPPGGGQYHQVTIDPPPAQNPSVTTLHATFSKAGYWRITNLKVNLIYLSHTPADTSNDLEAIAAKVELSPATTYLVVGGSAIVTVNVTPPDAELDLTFASQSPAIAEIIGDAPYLTALGIETGTTQVDALVGEEVVATTAVTVFEATYSPESGPVFQKVVFAIQTQGVNFFSANTTVKIDAVFAPEGSVDEVFSINHDSSKIKYDAGSPNQISLAVADVFPSEFLTSSNPGINTCVTGTVYGLVTLIDGDKQLTMAVQFEILPSGDFGKLVQGEFQVHDGVLPIWQANSSADLEGVDPISLSVRAHHSPCQ